ncbi:MAG: hypothetical protein EOO10_17795 [Chitinophagaceae bacterium]|nr:MAG: hypothetical protein EOO10_17795 [Chitinophagaceae bacterium]
MNLAISLRSEILKTRRTASLYFTLIGAAIVPFIFLFNVLLDDDLDGTKKDPLNGIFKLQAEMNGIAFFPWFIILVCTLLPQIEYRNNTWKQVFTSPFAKSTIYLSKFLNIQLLLLLFLVSTHLFMLIALVVANLIDPALDLFARPLNGFNVLANAYNAYISMMAICTIQFWMGLRFKNFIVPIAIGLALWLIGIVLVLEYKSSLGNYFPYSFQIFHTFPKYKSSLNQVAWTSCGYAGFFLLVGFLDFRRRRMSA